MPTEGSIDVETVLEEAHSAVAAGVVVAEHDDEEFALHAPLKWASRADGDRPGHRGRSREVLERRGEGAAASAVRSRPRRFVCVRLPTTDNHLGSSLHEQVTRPRQGVGHRRQQRLRRQRLRRQAAL